MRLAVTGGRAYGVVLENATADEERRAALEKLRVGIELDRIHQQTPIDLLIEGGAAGADRHAREWAVSNGVEVMTIEADWNTHGRSAGPKRNARIIAEGRPDALLAFPGGKGTADMCNKARAARVPIRRIEE